MVEVCRIIKKAKTQKSKDAQLQKVYSIDDHLAGINKETLDLFQDLREKILSLDQNIIEDVLSETEFDEVKTAKELLKNKAYKWQKLPSKEKRKKKRSWRRHNIGYIQKKKQRYHRSFSRNRQRSSFYSLGRSEG